MNIGIVNDTNMATQAITAALLSSDEHHVLWSATNGPDALRLCQLSTPDLVLMDLVMPGMNGVETTRAIMRSCPTTILVVTASINNNCGLAFEAMGAGALDVITTPVLIHQAGRHQFLQKISQIQSIIDNHPRGAGANASRPHKPHPAPPPYPHPPSSHSQKTTSTLVAIGCSAGGPAAISEILTALNPVNQAAVVIIQHIDARFIDDLARWLKGFSKDPLRLVAEGDRLIPGHIYLAGKDGHLETDSAGRLHYNPDLGGRAYQPSVDVFFSSIARFWRGNALGIVLTGMGRDGASGLHSMQDTGFLTLAQDEKSSALFGMPKAAAPFASKILPLPAMAPFINQWIPSHP